jgi:formylglycine-generating enzyme required for sulfatase activity
MKMKMKMKMKTKREMKMEDELEIINRQWVETLFRSGPTWKADWGQACDEAQKWLEQYLPKALILNKKDGALMVRIPEGEFEMGDGKDSNCPKHRVFLDEYWIGVFCVTNRQFQRFVKETGFKRDQDSARDQKLDHPVVNVNWADAAAYARWAGGELPTEAQWEKAARGPNGLIYPWGNEWDEKKSRNNTNRGGEETCPVYAYPKGVSGYGCYNMSGNVWEWCRDWYGEDYYTKGENRNPKGPEGGSNRVDRGGSWGDGYPANFRGANRNGGDPSYRGDRGGFRLVRTSP